MSLDSSDQYNKEQISPPANSRNIVLQAALDALGNEAETVAKSFENIQTLLMQIKDAVSESTADVKNQDVIAEPLNEKNDTDFRSVTGLEFISQNTVPSNDPGISSSTDITAILSILNEALEKVNNSETYNEISEEPDVAEEHAAQEYFPVSQNVIISPIQNTEIEEELEAACGLFLEQPSVAAFAQANQSAERFLQLIGS
ncbi:MAG: hypothetical protein V4642_12725 [Bacteroidota bacterium]